MCGALFRSAGSQLFTTQNRPNRPNRTKLFTIPSRATEEEINTSYQKSFVIRSFTMSRSSPSPRMDSNGHKPQSDIPHYTINLDLPPAQRWSEIIQHYRPYWHEMIKQMWLEFEDIHGDYLHEDEDAEEAEVKKSVDSSSKKSNRTSKRKPKLTAAEKAAIEARKHAKHVAFATRLAEQMMAAFRAQGLSEYAEELESVAAAAKIELHELVLLNLSYEAHGGCTTILTPYVNAHGKTTMIMGRTLDWQQPLLKHLTIELSFQRHGALLYRATSFAGFLGIFTGHKPNAYAVAVNFRCADEVDLEEGEGQEDDEDVEDEDEEEIDGADDGAEDDDRDDDDSRMSADSDIPDFSWPVGFLVRHTLESCSTYATAVDRLHRCSLMSQVYFILCGTNTEEATIITRNPIGSVKPIKIPTLTIGEQQQRNGSVIDSSVAPSSSSANSSVPTSTSTSSSSPSSSFPLTAIGAAPSDTIPETLPSTVPWLVQANMDHWLTSRRLDHQESLPRTRLVNQTLKGLITMDSSSMTEVAMWRLMGQHPIWDEETIYATIAIPAEDRFVTLIENPYPPPPVKKGKGRAKRR